MQGYDTFYMEEPEPEFRPPDSQPNGSCPQVGNPMVVASGNKVETEADFSSIGEPEEMPLYHNRVYNLHGSHLDTPGGSRIRPFGNEWRSNVEYYLRRENDWAFTALRSNGTAWGFSKANSSTNEYSGSGAGQGWSMTLLPNGDSEVRGPNGETELYSGTGRILRKANPNGISWHFTYNADRLHRVTHTSGRYIEYVWTSFPNSTFRVSRIRKPDGNIIDFGYTGGGSRRLDWARHSGAYGYRVDYHWDWAGRLSGKSFDGVRFSTFNYSMDTTGHSVVSSTEHAGGVNRNTLAKSYNEQNRLTVTVTNPYNKATRYYFNTLGQLEDVEGVASSHCLGGFVSTTFNSDGLPESRVDAEGAITKYEYYTNRQLQTQIEAFGTPEVRTTRLEWHGESKRPSRVIREGISETIIHYNAKNRISSQETRNLTAVGTLGEAHTTTYAYTYHPNGMPYQVTIDGPIAGPSDRIHYQYSASGDLQWIQNELGHRTTYSNHDGFGRPRTVVGPNGETTRYEYDASGLLVAQTLERPAGQDITRYRYQRGLLSEVEDGDGIVRHYQYDDARRLVGSFTLEEPGLVHHQEFTLNANSDVTVDSMYRRNYRPDSSIQGNLDGLSQMDTFVRVEGWVCARFIPTNLNVQLMAGGPSGSSGSILVGSTVANVAHEPTISDQCESGLSNHRYRIDIAKAVADNHAGKVLYPYVVSPISGALVLAHPSNHILPHPPYTPPVPPPCDPNLPGCHVIESFDESAAKSVEIPSAPASVAWSPASTLVRRTRYEYDELGRLRTVLGNNNQRTTFVYDRNDRLISETNALNQINLYRYNQHGEIRESVDSGQGLTVFTRDKAGRIVSVTDPRGNTTSYDIDGFGRVHRVSSPDTGMTLNHYDHTGRLHSTKDANQITRTFQYDALSRLQSITEGQQVHSFLYDTCAYGLGLLCAVQGSESFLQYDYEHFGGVIRQHAWLPEGGFIDYTFEYDHRGRQVKRTNERNQVAFKYVYDQGRLSAITTRFYSGYDIWLPVVDQVKYNETGAVESWRFGNGRLHHRYYDLDGRLTRILNPGSMDRSYGFDPANRKTSISQDSVHMNQIFDYNALDAVRQVTGFNAEVFQLDALSNRTSQTQEGASQIYNYAQNSNRLESIGGSVSRAFQYDSAGNIKNDSAVGNVVSMDYSFNRMTSLHRSGHLNSSTRYHYNPLGQRDFKSGNLGRWWFAYSIDGQLLSDFSEWDYGFSDYVYFGGIPVGFVREGMLRFVQTDHLGRPELVEDGSQTRVWQAQNGVFKREVVLDQIKGLNIGYPGQFYDRESGLFYNYFRYYDATTGRYTQSDPIGLRGGLNTYAYVEGNPVSFIDPLGLWRWPGTIADEATKDAHARFPRSAWHNGPGDAYRHCLASCMMTRENGASEALVLGWMHEKRGDWFKNQQCEEREMDDENNRIGRELGRVATSTQSCQTMCLSANLTQQPAQNPSGGYWY